MAMETVFIFKGDLYISIFCNFKRQLIKGTLRLPMTYKFAFMGKSALLYFSPFIFILLYFFLYSLTFSLPISLNLV